MPDVLVKSEDATSQEHGCAPDKRPVEELLRKGVVNLDKPRGPTSHQVAAWVKAVFGVKTGHGGTLDPAVSGCLPVFLGIATRLSDTILLSSKEYVCLMRLHGHASKRDITSLLKKFQGNIYQRPPVKSSVKRVLRKRRIYEIELLEIEENDVLFRISCEAGTYIRKYCLHPDTEILSKDGVILAQEIPLNSAPIYSKDGKKIKQKHHSDTQELDFVGSLIRIRMASGIEFAVTPEHRMLVSTNSGYVMKKASLLKTSDYIVKSLDFPLPQINPTISDLLDDGYLISQADIKERVKEAFIKKYGSIRGMYRKLGLDRKAFLSNSNNAIPIGHVKAAAIYDQIKPHITEFKTEKGARVKLHKLDSDLLYLVGLIASDGNNTKEKRTRRHTRVKFHNKQEELINEFLIRYKQLFPDFNINKTLNKDGITQLDTSNSFLATICQNLGVISPQEKSDIRPIMYLDNKLVASFLKGYFDGDGSVYYKKKIGVKGTYTKICFYTVSGVIAKRLHQMLLKLGIDSKIFRRKDSYVVSIDDIAAKKRFIELVGSNHPLKKERFGLIAQMPSSEINDGLYVGLHYKHEIKKSRHRLKKMGGNLNRVLNTSAPLTRGFYRKASRLANLSPLDGFCIEKIKSIQKMPYTGKVHDMTVPKTHNFLIETGFVSSNCHDFGLILGTEAHMQELRRVKSGIFTEDEFLVTLQDLKDAYVFWKEGGEEKFIRRCVLPMEYAVQDVPKVWVRDSAIDALCHGSDLAAPGVVKLEKFGKDKMVAVMSLKGELVALGEALEPTETILRAKKGFVVKTSRVFMEPGTYPKGWKKEGESQDGD